MSNILEHRGPDGIGTSSGNNFIFGHRRLAIIDLDYGLQPMISEDKSITLIFNGEIYNYLELRQDLVRKGIRFKTHSDTEVLLRCYEYYGKEMLSKLNGMFAFAIFDSKTNTFFAARDHFGIKPLYYTILKDGSLVFSSEIKLYLCPRGEKSPDMLGLHEYLTFQYCLDDKTMFTGIKKLLPAHSLSINLSDPKIKISKWWDQSFEIDQTKKTEYFKDNLNYLIHDSIKNQLRGDVPIGAHLSGGLTLALLFLQRLCNWTNFKSFTGKFWSHSI